MKRTTRTATAAFAAAIAFGISSPAAVAGPHGPGGDHPSHGHGPATSPGDRKFQADQRQALSELARLDEQVGRAVDDSRLSRLVPVNGVDVAAAVLANADADRAALADTTAAVEAATPGFDFRALREDLRSFRPENYRIVVNALRRAGEIDAAADAVGGVPDVDTALDAAVAAAGLVTARSPKTDFRAILTSLADAEAALEAAGGTDDDSSDDPDNPDEPDED